MKNTINQLIKLNEKELKLINKEILAHGELDSLAQLRNDVNKQIKNLKIELAVQTSDSNDIIIILEFTNELDQEVVIAKSYKMPKSFGQATEELFESRIEKMLVSKKCDTDTSYEMTIQYLGDTYFTVEELSEAVH